MNASRVLVFLLLLVAAGVAVAMLMFRGDQQVPPDLTTPPVAQEQEQEQETTPTPAPAMTTESREGVPTPKANAPTRTQVEEVDSASFAQGARGVVVDPAGNPLPGTKVFLVEGTANDLVRHMQLQNQGVVVPPLASAQSDSNGAFALGVEQADPAKMRDAIYEVRVVSDRFVDQSIPNLHLTAGQWYDVGTIRLARGAILTGRVTIQGSAGLPVPGAKVSVKTTSPFFSLTPTPGREDGLVAEVDHTGTFRFENVPPGIVNLAALAPGYARIEKQNVQILADAPNTMEFELPPGVSIGGTVTDATGAPVPGAKVEAIAISSKTTIRNSARSEQDGRFEVIGLIDGAYSVSATAPGFVVAELKPIQAGQKDVQIVLEKQGSAQLRVYAKDGRVLPRYQVTVKKYFEGQKQFGNSVIQPQTARPDRSGIFLVEGLNPDSYVFQIEAEGHAKAFSDPFKVTLGAEAPLVEVRLNEGGGIDGTVVDEQGRPLAGVTVRTLPNDFDENPFTKMFKDMIPFTITQTTVQTNANGEYSFRLLNSGTYQLKFIHPEHYDVSLRNNEVVAGVPLKVKQLVMQRGTQVSGVVRVDGVPAAQTKVTVTALPDPSQPGAALLSAESISDEQGNFVLPKRMPPGNYTVMAARQTLANPILQIADFHKTRQEFTLVPGQQTFHVQINIPSQQ
jgi:protocatechuate 3,4-dioxygenase beta subunit